MSTSLFPYSYISCPCTKTKPSEYSLGFQKNSQDSESEEEAFNPRGPRANYSLYPPEHLLWCEDCQQIRCPKCVIEEVVCWYCPNCTFEVPSGVVRSEGNRCTRNCFNCPICTAPLQVNTLDSESGGIAGPWILACDYCNWTSLDINIKFDRPNNIYGQLQRLQSGKSSSRSIRSTSISETEVAEQDTSSPPPQDHDSRFAALRKFYSEQIQKSQTPNPFTDASSELNYNSPSSLARIMSIYTNTSAYGKKPAKATPMRAAQTPQEGMLVHTKAADEEAIARLHDAGLEGTTTAEQAANQPGATNLHLVADLRPVPTLLRTKRSRRCRECRHILVRPEPKVSSTRYRIKLVALEHVPAMSLAPLATDSGAPPSLDLTALPPSRPLQFLLTLKNPMFDPVRVTLATPGSTPAPPGRPATAASRVTILCPQFDIGANTDVWDEALTGDATRRISKLGLSASKPDAEPRVAEAGKVWDKGRNWTTVVLEVICGRLERDTEPQVLDEDVLEIPISVRIEYEKAQEEVGGKGGAEDRREKRELAYWCVLGVGRIAKVAA